MTGSGWIAAGVLVAAWPDLSIFGVAPVTGVAMIAGGAIEAIGGFRGTTDERLGAVIGGAATVIFGVLALAWPDVTVLVVAVLFGARTIVLGVRTLAGALRAPRSEDTAAETTRRRGALRRWLHVGWATIGLVLALALAGLSATLNGATGTVDAFYTTPEEVPAEPGVLLGASPSRGTCPRTFGRGGSSTRRHGTRATPPSPARW